MPSQNDLQQQDVSNYLIPAAGQTHSIRLSGVFSAVAVPIDWRQYGWHGSAHD
jgi:hypothetical protein